MQVTSEMQPTTSYASKLPTLSIQTIVNSPSHKSQISTEVEINLRVYACELIQQTGVLLKFPQSTMARAQMILHRFYMKRSVTEFCVRYVALACLFLSSKLSDQPAPLQSVIEAFDYLLTHIRRESDYRSVIATVKEEAQATEHPILKVRNEVIRVERFVCTDLGFVFHNIDFAHTYILFYMHVLEGSDELVQSAWNYCNDALRCRILSLHVKPHIMACGAIYMAAKKLQIKLPEDPGWWLVFETTYEDLLMVEKHLNNLYTMDKARFQYVTQQSTPTLYVSPDELAKSQPPVKPTYPQQSSSANNNSNNNNRYNTSSGQDRFHEVDRYDRRSNDDRTSSYRQHGRKRPREDQNYYDNRDRYRY